MEIIRGLGWVDSALLLPCSTTQAMGAAAWIADWGIHHVVAGGGWSGSPRWVRLTSALAERRISVGFAPHTEGISTTEIIASIRQDTENARDKQHGRSDCVSSSPTCNTKDT